MKNANLFFIALLLSTTSILSQPGWQQIFPGSGQNITSVHFADQNTGMACGSNGLILKTTNGGANWTQQVSGVTLSLNQVKMYSTSVAIAGGQSQTILRTSNGGSNWSIVYQGSPANNSIQNLCIFSTGGAAAFSQYYNVSEFTYIYRTTNYGLNWQVNQTYVPNRWIHFIDLNNGWAHGTTHLGPPINQYYLDINRTLDGGANWGRISRSDGTSINPGMIYFYNEMVGFKYSHLGYVYLSRTNDGGYTWLGTGPSLTDIINCFFMVNAQKGWYVGDNSKICMTTNSGANWIQQNSPVSSSLKEVYFIDENTGWIAAGTSGILKTTTGGITEVRQLGTELPVVYMLSQNYPNPFNPETKIKFSIPATSSVAQTFLTVYNVLGQQVAVLVNQNLQPGTYEVNWNAADLTSGVYFYTLKTEEYSKTKKMLLIK